MNKMKRIWSIVILLLAVGGAKSLFAEANAYFVYTKGVIDLRGNNQFNQKIDNAPRGMYSSDDLYVGAVFIDANLAARKVTAIYEENGITVVETKEPQIEEVFQTFYIPDQDIELTEDNIDPLSVHEGVTFLNPAEAQSLASESRSSRATFDSDMTWLETDTDWMGRETYAQKIDITLFEGAASLLDLVDDSDEENGGDGDTSGDGTQVSDEDSSSGSGDDVGTEKNAEVSGKVGIKGVLRIAKPKLNAGIKKPVMHIDWVWDWGPFGHPEISFEDGYAKAYFSAAQQFDGAVTGSVSLTADVKIPLYAIVAKYGPASFTVGIYLKCSVEGTITVEFEMSEYTTFWVRGTVDLVWPFIPVDASTDSGSYANFAVRPTISAEVEQRNGVYLGLDAEIAGISVLGAEVGGGVYERAEGYITAKSIIGYSSDSGFYGSLDDWLWQITIELGGYVEGNLSIAFWDFNLFEKKWPFFTKTWEGEI